MKLPSSSCLSLVLSVVVLAGAGAHAAAPKDERGKLDAGCQAGKTADCVDLAYMFANGDRGPEDQGKALSLYTRACDLKEPQGCHEAARYYHVGKHVKGDGPKAMALYEQACDGGYLEGCRQLGGILREGKLTPQDLPKVRVILGKACKFGEGKSCYDLGIMYQEGQGGAEDLPGARTQFQSGCDAQDARCCLQLAFMQRDGVGGKKDDALAKQTFGLACTYGGARFCGQEAGNPLTPPSGPVDDSPCTGANTMKCLVLDIARYTPSGGVGKLKPSEDFFRKKCDESKGKDAACYKLALIVHAEDVPKARAAYERACTGGTMDACVNLGYMWITGQGGDIGLAKARALFTQACDKGDALGCLNQAIDNYNVHGAARDDITLAKFEAACNAGEPVGCFNQGVMLNLGMGADANPEKAQALFKNACADGVTAACKAKQ